jgi:hypothetical protein
MSENTENSNETSSDNNETLPEEKSTEEIPTEEKEINDYEIDNCPMGNNCPVKIAMDAGLSPEDVKDDINVRNHITSHHVYLNSYYENPINSLIDSLIRRRDESKRLDLEKKNQLSCFSCNKCYDEDRNRYYLSCCANPLCHECVFKMKNEKCPFCKRSLEYLKDFKLEKKSKTEGEECFLCCSVLNSTQHTGKVKLDCKCQLELCITCAYKSLQDSHDNERVTVLEDGERVRETYTIKGRCPQCREIPKNKEEINMLYGFLPPSY